MFRIGDLVKIRPLGEIGEIVGITDDGLLELLLPKNEHATVPTGDVMAALRAPRGKTRRSCTRANVENSSK
jgi:hypothetical protein